MNTIDEAIVKLDARLQGVPFDFAFLGGSVLSLLVTDPSVSAIRVTKDIDVIVDVKTRKAFHVEERVLERLGFKHDTSEDAPVCRWVVDGVKVDVLPVREEVLGWKSKWFEEALGASCRVSVGDREVKVISAPYFVALKLEAFESRGGGDFLTSTDFEDVICLLNGREGIVDEIKREAALCQVVSEKFAEYLKSPELEDAVEGFAFTETNPEVRKRVILDRFAAIASARA